MAGYAVSQVGVINAGQPTSILIGAPGFNVRRHGTAYLIPGRAGLDRDVLAGHGTSRPRSPAFSSC